MSRKSLARLAIGVLAVALAFAFGKDEAETYAVLLLGTSLIVWQLIGHATLHGMAKSEPPQSIPIRFSGDLGRFELRSHGDGRRVEVRSGDAVVAALIATDGGDELVLDFSLAGTPDADAFGAAIGRAIDMVAAADENLSTSQERRSATAPASFRGIIDGAWCRD